MEAIILAGGKGTRLQAVVSDVPKPLAPIQGTPFLNFLLKYLKNQGVSRVVLSVGYLKEKIYEIYSHGFEGIELDFCEETEPLGTGGAVVAALEKTQADHVWILNGDTFFDVQLDKMKQFHEQHQSEFTLALKPMSDLSRYGNVKLSENYKILSFEEKGAPRNGVNNPGLINGGIYLINRDVIKKYFQDSFLEDSAQKKSKKPGGIFS